MEYKVTDFLNFVAKIKEIGAKAGTIERIIQPNPFGIGPGITFKVQKDLYRKEIPDLQYCSSN